MKSTVTISVENKNGSTCLQDCFFNPPFRIVNISGKRARPQLDLVMMCSSPGILDKDEWNFEVVVGAYSHLRLHTQSYHRIFKMKEGASQSMQVCLQDGSSFTWLPHPSVPHEESIFCNRNKIFLQGNCTLVWGEIITCGRQLHNEVFSFSKYHNITEVFLNDKLVIKENLLMEPGKVNLQRLGQLEGYTHQASLFYLSADVLLQEKTNTVLDYLATQSFIEYGITRTSIPGFMVRILGYKAEQLHQCLNAIASLVHSTGVENIFK